MRAFLRVGILSALAAFGAACSSGPHERIAELARLGADPDAAALDRLEAATGDGDAGVRALAIATIAEADPARVVPIAAKALEDASDTVRAAAARALGLAKAAGAGEALAGRLRRDPSWEVRRRAAEALGAIGGDAAGPALRDALLDPEPDVRVAAARALAEVDPKGSARACAFVMMTDDDWKVRVEAARVLGRAGTDEARAALEESARIDRNEFVRAEARRGARP